MIRKAKLQDVPQIIQLVNYYAQKDIMLGISKGQTYSKIREFFVVEKDKKITACGALHIYWDQLAEIRSLAVHEDYLGNGLGKNIVEALLNDAQDLGVGNVFTLTLKPVFFEKLGFAIIEKEKLPHKIWQDCMNCPKFPHCDEIALILSLSEEAKDIEEFDIINGE